MLKLRKPTPKELREAKNMAKRCGHTISKNYMVMEFEKETKESNTAKIAGAFAETMRAINASRK